MFRCASSALLCALVCKCGALLGAFADANCVHWAIEGVGRLERERERERERAKEKVQQQREEKSSGCKFCNLMKMKIPAASCNFLLLFLFFIFCHLDLCSSLRLIGLGNSLTLSSFQKNVDFHILKSCFFFCDK